MGTRFRTRRHLFGMVLAMPIVAMLRIVLSNFSTTRSLANLLAGHLLGTGRRNHVS